MKLTKEDKMAYTLYLFIALVVLALAASGCATFKAWVNEDELAQLEVEASVAEILKQNPSWQNETINITGQAIDAIDKRTLVDIKSAEAYIRNHIKWGSMASESQVLLSVLITKWRTKIEKRLADSGVIRPLDQMVELRQVVVWMNDAAKRPLR